MAATEQKSIQQIADQATSLRQFYHQYLTMVSTKVDCIGAVAWHCSKSRFAPIAQIKQPDDQPIKMSVSQARHEAILNQALSSPDPIVVHPEVDETKDFDVPILLLAKLKRGNETDIIEVFLPPKLSEETYKQRLRALVTMNHQAENVQSQSNSASLAPRLSVNALAPHNRDTTAPPRNAADLLSQRSENALSVSVEELDQFSHVVHQSLNPLETARKITNEVRRVLDCDRVTLMQVTGKRVKSIAVSGQPSVNRRSNTIRLLEKAAKKIVAIRKVFWFPSDEQQPPQIAKPLNEYLAQCATRSMVVYPIFDQLPVDLTNPDQRARRKQQQRVIGTIIIEHCQQQWDRDGMSGAIEMICRHSQDAYRNATQHRSLFGYPLWRWLGKSRVLTTASNLPKTIMAAIALTLATLAMVFVPTDFRMTCEGTLLPQSRRRIFANISGVVKDVMVDHGQIVEPGDPLVRLENLELRQQIETAVGKKQELTEIIRSVRTAISNRRNQSEERRQNISALEAQIKSITREIELLRNKEKRLTVNSPIAGSIVTYNVRDLLQDRPVERVQALMEVANLAGRWQLELNLPDRKIGHVVEAFEKEGVLDVEFILAADPGKTFQGKLIEIGKATEMLSESGQFLKLKVAIEDETLDIKQLRSSANAYIHCGKCSLGYAWFHPVWEFVQSRVLFPVL